MLVREFEVGSFAELAGGMIRVLEFRGKRVRVGFEFPSSVDIRCGRNYSPDQGARETIRIPAADTIPAGPPTPIPGWNGVAEKAVRQ